MTNFIQITPVMRVRDLEEALTFFEAILGFETRVRAHDYAYLERETAGIRILENERAGCGRPAICLLHRRARRR